MTHVCLLRGINVSGQKKILMGELKTVFELQGFQNVATYIQSGNVLFDLPAGASSAEQAPASLKATIFRAIRDRWGFDVGVFVLPQNELRRRYEACPFRDQALAEGENVYFSFLSAEPVPELSAKLLALANADDTPALVGNTFSLYCRKGYGRSVFSNTMVEKTLKVTATTRNRATVRFLLGIVPSGA